LTLLNRNDISVIILAIIVFACGVFYSKSSISAMGLTLDVTGFLLLWRFGLPSHLKPGGEVVGTRWDVEIDENEKKKFNFAKGIGDFSVLLIVTGFILQFIGNIK
jgi:hypothetical protein